MKPFRRKQRYRKRIITYKRLFMITLISFMAYMWYQTCDEEVINNNKTAEVK